MADSQPRTKSADFRLGVVYAAAINGLFALGVIAIFYSNRVPLWLWILFLVKQLLAIPIYIASDFALGNLGRATRGQTTASFTLVFALIALQVILKSVVVHYSTQYTLIPGWVWSFSSFASIILVLLSSLGGYQDSISVALGVPLPSVNIAVRMGILVNLALFSASTIALAVYGNQSWTTGLFIIMVLIQLVYAFKTYLLSGVSLERLTEDSSSREEDGDAL